MRRLELLSRSNAATRRAFSKHHLCGLAYLAAETGTLRWVPATLRQSWSAAELTEVSTREVVSFSLGDAWRRSLRASLAIAICSESMEYKRRQMPAGKTPQHSGPMLCSANGTAIALNEP